MVQIGGAREAQGRKTWEWCWKKCETKCPGGEIRITIEIKIRIKSGRRIRRARGFIYPWGVNDP